MTIKVKPDGPLVMMGEADIHDAEGNLLEPKKVTPLCRCGASKNKPYCDGTHREIGFDGGAPETRAPVKSKVYSGKALDVHYNQALCSHAAVCGSRLPDVFNPKNRPWVNPDNGDADAIKAVVEACPSGALSCSTPGGDPEQLVPDKRGISIEKNGPLHVTGLELEDAVFADGASPDKYVLCRCGASKNKPFCDGSHADVGWQDT